MKVLKFFALQLMLTLVLLPAAQGQQDTTRPRVAVVLSGGGAKGVAHIGALKVIEEAGIPVDIVCGTSMGSLIGGLYAIGWTTAEMDSLVRAQDWPLLLTDRENPAHLTLEQRHWLNTYAIQYQVSTRSLPKPMGGLIRGDNLELLFTKLCTGYLDSIDFNTLPIPYACVATNIVDNGEVVFHSGSLRQAMRASMAIPGVFTPVRLDSMVLVDGGLRNNYPADVAREMGADIVIGVTVQGEPLDAEKLDNAMTVFTQIIDINCKNKYDANIASSDVVANVCVKGYSAASFTPEAVDTLLRRGEEAMRLHWDELLALRRNAGIDSVVPRHIVHPVIPEEEVRASKRLSPLAMAGFRFDTEEMGALQLGGSIPVRGRFPMRVDLNMRLGQRMAAGVQISTPKTVHTALAYTFQRNALDIYTAGDRSYSVKYRHHQAEVIPLNLKFSRLVLQLGARWDYFNYYGRILTAGEDLVDLTSEHYFSLRLGLMQNNEDHWYFPTRGSRFSAAYFYRTDNLIGMDGKPGISDAAASWRVSLPLTSTFTLQPMAYSRLLFGGAIPLAYRNGIGGEWYGHYVEQQMPFAGIGHLELTERFFAGVQLQAQQRVGKHHYVLARVAVGLQDGDFDEFLGWPDMFGMQLGYSYNSILGPLDVRLGWSDMTHELYFYLNLGHEF